MEMSGIVLNEIKADDKDLFWLLYLKLPTVSKSSEKRFIIEISALKLATKG